jgi:hypothetical protein
MDSTDQESPLDTVDPVALARAVRLLFVVFVVVLSFPSILLSFRISGFESIYNEMLNGRPLPLVTFIVVRTKTLLMAGSLLLPAAALATLGMRQIVRALYLLGALGFFAVFQAIVLYVGLTSPLFMILRTIGDMASNPGTLTR